jgi:hypothetical protein
LSGSRKVEELDPGEVVVYDYDGIVFALTGIRPQADGTYQLTYEVLALPDGSDPAALFDDVG